MRMLTTSLVAFAAIGSLPACGSTIHDGAGGANGVSYRLVGPQAVGSGAKDLVLFDCNADGHLDIAVANSESATVSVLVGHGDGTFDFQKTYSAHLNPWMLAVGDFDANGSKDLAVANFVDGASVMLGNEDCSFAPAAPLDTVMAFTVAAGDLDGDGNDDIVAQRSLDIDVGEFIVFWGHGNATFDPPAAIPTKTGVGDILLADFNEDGKPDIAGSSSWLSGSSGSQAYVHVALNLGSRQFGPASDNPVNPEPEGLAIADFDSDGHLDVATPGDVSFESGSVSLLRGDGSGNFQAQVTFPTKQSEYGNATNGIAAGDLNGDDHQDAVVAIGMLNEVGVLFGGAPNIFEPMATFTTDSVQANGNDWNPYYVAVGDLNEDGRLDIVATHFDAVVSILLAE